MSRVEEAESELIEDQVKLGDGKMDVEYPTDINHELDANTKQTGEGEADLNEAEPNYTGDNLDK